MFSDKNKKINKFLKFGFLIFFLLFVLIVPNYAKADFDPSVLLGPISQIQSLPKHLALFLLMVSNGILTFSAKFFDGIIKISILDMASSVNDQNGIGGSINMAWSTFRDIANIGFIFILLWTAFKAMFDLSFGNVGKTIGNIIIAALLINFSLFLTKVVIDASNIVSIGFYNVITGNGQTIASNYSSLLNIQTWWSPQILDLVGNNLSILQVGFLGSIFLLVVAVVFFVMGIMFLTRYILLIIVMILSPIAVIAFAVPGGDGIWKKWFSALINQSFFAPVFFALTWVSLRVASSPNFIGGGIQKKDFIDLFTTSPSASYSLLLNYALITGFAVASLILSKNMATKTSGFNTVAGGLGAVGMGGAALIGRQTVGRYANKIANDKDLQERAARGDVGARMKLASAQKIAGSSFDIRGIADTKVGKFVKADEVMGIAGKASGVGGQKAVFDKKTDDRRKPIDATMRQFRDKPDVLAGYLLRQKPEDQQYMYDKLGARDRAAVNDELDKLGATATKLKLMGNMSIDEQEKTAKAGKEAAKDRQNKDRLDTINKIATDPTFAATFTPTALDAIIKGLPNTQARRLSLSTLSGTTPGSKEIIMRLSTKHLADIANNHDEFDDEAAKKIWDIVNGPPYPTPLVAHQKKQWDYLTSAGVKANWGIP